ncbi:hypothetical protein EES46_29700 [Streptomyces sp. ADI98-10]|nr:hypothetical protein EES46_29700 [Streptomyces sp. ADI98-10]
MLRPRVRVCEVLRPLPQAYWRAVAYEPTTACSPDTRCNGMMAPWRPRVARDTALELPATRCSLPIVASRLPGFGSLVTRTLLSSPRIAAFR